MRGGERIERFLDLRGDPGLVETLGPVNLKAHHGPTIEHGNLRAFGNAVMHGRHLVQANLSPACQHDGKRIKFGCVPDGSDGADRLLVPANMGAPARRLMLDFAQGAGPPGRGNPEPAEAHGATYERVLPVTTHHPGYTAYTRPHQHGLSCRG